MRYFLGYSKLAGLAVTIFVMLVGVLGYTYISHINAEVAATQPSELPRVVAQREAATTTPTVESTADLDAAATTLDSVSNDDNLAADLSVLDSADIDF
jgi:uncharacterized membrane protein affecting hemolysin expression